MGFFLVGKKMPSTRVEGFSLDMLHKNGCRACPLSKEHAKLEHPDMQPHGSERPLIYVLGSHPNDADDARGRAFSGRPGRKLNEFLPRDIAKDVRFGNIVRTRTPKHSSTGVNRTPTEIEVECCRPSIIADIEETKPRAIIGLGPIVLKWAINQTAIHDWRGRCVPIQIGNHKCWFFPVMSPEYLLEKEKAYSNGGFTSEFEFAFFRDLQTITDTVGDLPDPVIHTKEDVFADIEFVTGANGWDDVNRVRDVLDEMSKSKYVGFDWETKNLRPYHENSKILTMAVSNGKINFAFPLDHSQAKWTIEQREEIHTILFEFFFGNKCIKISHHLTFEMEWTAFHFGKKVLRSGLWGDTESQAYVMHGPGELSLNALVLNYFGIEIKPLTNVDTNNLDSTDLKTVLIYNVIDAKYHRKLYIKQKKRIEELGLVDVYNQQLRRVPTVVLTQMKGVPVNPETVAFFDKKFTKQLEKIEAKIFADPDVIRFEKITGAKFKPGSPHDVRKLVMKVLKLETEKADEEALRKIKAPIAKHVLTWRRAKKMHSTYVEPLMPGAPHLYPGNLLHPIIGVTTVKTWRTSSEEPNEQNFPKHKNREVRSQIAARAGSKLIAFDYAGIQARNVAMESRDKNLVQAFKDRYDIHLDWMKEIQDIHPQWANADRLANDKDYMKEHRQKAKNGFVFATFFGARPSTITRAMQIPVEVSEEAQRRFWKRFPDIKKWHLTLEKNYRKNGYVTGLSGFRRYAPVSPNEIINTPIQSDEAAIVLDAMARLSELEQARFQANLEIHDDLSFFWKTKEIDNNIEVVVKEMVKISFPWINVPLTVEVSIGDDWANLTEIGVYSSDLGWEKKEDWRHVGNTTK